MKTKMQNIKKNIRLSNVSLIVMAVFMLLSSLSLAYFTKKDVVSNKLTGNAYEIKLYEQNWSSVGIDKADELVPGQVIPKDPNAFNASDEDVYVRMKYLVLDKDKKDMSVSNPQRYERILDSITSSSDNYFCKHEGWYYYVNSGKVFQDFSVSTEEVLKALPPEGSTSKLFDSITVPSLKVDYIGTFDEVFYIYVIAQGIPVVKSIENGEVKIVDKSLQETIDEFENKYFEYSFE